MNINHTFGSEVLGGVYFNISNRLSFVHLVLLFLRSVSSYCSGDRDEDQNTNSGDDLRPALKQDEEANSGNRSKGTMAGSSKTWVA